MIADRTAHFRLARSIREAIIDVVKMNYDDKKYGQLKAMIDLIMHNGISDCIGIQATRELKLLFKLKSQSILDKWNIEDLDDVQCVREFCKNTIVWAAVPETRPHMSNNYADLKRSLIPLSIAGAIIDDWNKSCLKINVPFIYASKS